MTSVSIRTRFVSCATLALCVAPVLVPRSAGAFAPDTTVAGVVEQAALGSRLHQRLVQRLGQSLGLFEPLRLDLNQLPDLSQAATPTPSARTARVHALYGRLSGLDVGQGYAPEWLRTESLAFPVARQHALGWVAAGAVIEFSPTARLRHHFFTPQTGLGLRRGAEQSALDASIWAVQKGVSSTRDLLTGTAVDGTGMSAAEWLVSPENDQGLQAFLQSYERAVLAGLPAERQGALAEALLSVGSMLGTLIQLGDPAFVRGDLDAVLLSDGARRVSARFGRAGIPPLSKPSPAGFPAEPASLRLSDLISDGNGGGLAAQTEQICRPAVVCYVGEAEAQIKLTTQYARRLLDYLFRGALRLVYNPAQDQLLVQLDEWALGSGHLTVLAETPDGTRRTVRIQSTPPTLAGSELATVALPKGELVGVQRLVVLYKGRDRHGQPHLVSSELMLRLGQAAGAP